MYLIGLFIMTVGIAVSVKSNLGVSPVSSIPLAGEGAMQAVSQVTGIAFSKVKIAFDCSMVTISAITCLLMIHGLGSVGIGTVIAAVLVGYILGCFTKLLGGKRDQILHGTETEKHM